MTSFPARCLGLLLGSPFASVRGTHSADSLKFKPYLNRMESWNEEDTELNTKEIVVGLIWPLSVQLQS
jgi:hypothetical protein